MKRLGYLLLRATSALQSALRERLTGAGGVVLGAAGLAGAAGFDTTQTLTYQAFTFFVALLLVSWLGILFQRHQITGKRDLPRYATVGETLHYDVTVSNPGRRAIADGRLIERLADPRPSYEQWLAARDPEL